MIPFEDLVAALERFKARKAATSGAPAAPAGKAVSGKQAQQATRQSALELGEDLISEE